MEEALGQIMAVQALWMANHGAFKLIPAEKAALFEREFRKL